MKWKIANKLIFILMMTSVQIFGQTSMIEEQKKMMEAIKSDFEAMMSRIKETLIITYRDEVAGSGQIQLAEAVAGTFAVDHTSDVELSEESVDEMSMMDIIPARWPVKDHPKISSPYGYRKDPFTKRRTFHHGIDIPMAVNTPVHATASGVVIKTGFNNRSGRYLIIEHKNHKTIYAHLNSILIKEGQHVKPETIIGYSGNTGRSTGPHLHYQISTLDGYTINPLSLINSN